MKKVILLVEVPEGDYCFGGKGHECCEHFDNGSGHNECDLGFIVSVKWNPEGVLKDPKCKALEEVKT